MKKKYPLAAEDVVRHAAVAATCLGDHRKLPLSKIHAILDGVDEYIGTRGVKTKKLVRAIKDR